jgi:cytochrome c-type biogenesis protein CcmH/NrfG
MSDANHAHRLLSDRRYSQALTAFLEVLKSDPRDAGSWFGAGQAAIETGRVTDGVQYLKRATELSPNDAQNM